MKQTTWHLYLGVGLYLLLVFLTYALYSINDSLLTFKEAIREGNTGKIEKFVDFPALQNSLTLQLKKAIIDKTTLQPDLKKDEEIGVKAIYQGMSLIKDFITLYVSPEGMKRLDHISQQTTHEDSRKAINAIKLLSSNSLLPSREVKLHSIRSVSVIGQDENGRQYQFVFSFNLLRWVLTDIRLDLDTIESRDVIEFLKKFNH